MIGRKSGTIFLDQSHNEIKQNQRIHGLLSKLSLKWHIFRTFFVVSPGMEINLPPSFSRLHRILVETSTLRCKFIAELLINFHSSRRFFRSQISDKYWAQYFLTNSYSGIIKWKASSSFPAQSFRNREDNIPLSEKKTLYFFQRESVSFFRAKVAHGILSGKYATAPQEHQEKAEKQTDQVCFSI